MSPRSDRPSSARAGATAAALVLAVSACVLTDQYINISDETISNRTPVRIVEPIQLTAEVQKACADDPDFGECPQPPPDDPTDVLPHFLNPVDYDFCSCPQGRSDLGAQPDFPIFIADRDQDTNGDYDDIFAALLLDYSPSNNRPHTSVGYRDYVNPQEPVPLASGIEYEPIGQHEPILRELRLGNENRPFDFCNGAGGTALAPGYHSLTVVVSDRPWFTPEEGSIQEGVPDFANGASFDTLTYVFFCNDSGAEDCQTACAEELPP